MPPVIFSPTAIRDLKRLRAFLQPQNPSAAKRAGEVILRGVQTLGTYPRMGRLIEDLPESYREWLIDFGHSGYVARYRIDNDRVIILAIRHQREIAHSP